MGSGNRTRISLLPILAGVRVTNLALYPREQARISRPMLSDHQIPTQTASFRHHGSREGAKCAPPHWSRPAGPPGGHTAHSSTATDPLAAGPRPAAKHHLRARFRRVRVATGGGSSSGSDASCLSSASWPRAWSSYMRAGSSAVTSGARSAAWISSGASPRRRFGRVSSGTRSIFTRWPMRPLTSSTLHTPSPLGFSLPPRAHCLDFLKTKSPGAK